MRVKTVSTTYERKIPVTQWGSVTLGGTIWADVDEDEDYQAVMKVLRDGLKAQVRADFEELPAPLKQYYAKVVAEGASGSADKASLRAAHEMANDRAAQMQAIQKGES